MQSWPWPARRRWTTGRPSPRSQARAPRPGPEPRRELPTADPAGPGLAVVVFGLASAVAWGAGDFGGGWTSRRAPVLGIAIGVDLLGTITMVGIALVTGE